MAKKFAPADREDVGARWQRKVKALEIDDWIARQQASILDELRGRLTEFSREMSVESKLVAGRVGRRLSERGRIQPLLALRRPREEAAKAEGEGRRAAARHH